MEAYSRKQVRDLIIGLTVFSGANDNQGLNKIKGSTYGEIADTILETFDEKLLNENTELLCRLFPTE
jgi:hypothetical protein